MFFADLSLRTISDQLLSPSFFSPCFCCRVSAHANTKPKEQTIHVNHTCKPQSKSMDRNTNEDSKTSGGDGVAAAGSGGDHGGRSADGDGTDRPRRRRSGDALRLQEALLTRRDGLLGGAGSSASLDALDTSPRGNQQRRRRVRSRQASEDLLTMAASDAALGRGGERDQQDADGQQAGDSTAAVGLGQQRQGGEAEQSRVGVRASFHLLGSRLYSATVAAEVPVVSCLSTAIGWTRY